MIHMERITLNPRQIMPNLWRFEDTCNVYVFNFNGHGLAIDFGSGKWLKHLAATGISRLDHVLLTHHHAGQCAGLLSRKTWHFAVHAPVGEEKFLEPAALKDFYRKTEGLNYTPYWHYATLSRGIPGVLYDIRPHSEQFFFNHCFRFVLTPGHGPNACTMIVEYAGKQIAFCGDAAYAGGTIWEPYHLEWDHWTGTGTLAAWEGVTRLGNIGLDFLCPSHGALITERPRAALNLLAKRLLAFYRAKGSVCAGEKDHFVIGTPMTSGPVRILPHLYLLGTGNGYLLVSRDKKGLVVDPVTSEMPRLEALLKELGGVEVEAAIVSHYHYDHCEGIPYLQRKHGVKAWIHPRVAEKMTGPAGARPCFCMPRKPIKIDHLLPRTGGWQWHEYEFSVAPWPGQTWWHAVYMAEIDGKKVMFSGDSFQPASRWNGTGGFCAINNSRFREGFVGSARLALKWNPDIMAAGHRCVYQFTRSRFERIIKWARFAEKAVTAICPSGSLEKDYYSPFYGKD